MKNCGFSLIEILSVIAIISLLATFSIPALQSLAGSASVNTAIGNLSGTFEMARSYAMSHRTYVRLGMTGVAAGSAHVNPSTLVAVIYSTDGSLANDTENDMNNESKWRQLNRPLILANLWVNDSLNAAGTANDALPSGTDFEGFTRKAGDFGPQRFTSIIQFDPTGEARILKGQFARHIKVGIDQLQNSGMAVVTRNQNPFVLRLSGINGTISLLRKEDLN
jgi:prepilin-type N-terminal cleavage/methylation domain-containing protein